MYGTDRTPATLEFLNNPSIPIKSYSASIVAVRGAPRDNFFAAVGNSQRWVSADLFLRKRSRDAVEYIAELPKAEHDANEWQAAMQAPLLVVEHDGPTMLARIGVMRALNRGYVREF